MPRTNPTLGVGLEFLETHDLLKIRLLSGATYWVGSGRVTAQDPTILATKEFQPYLAGAGESRQTVSLATDRIPLVIHNVDKLFGGLINDPATEMSGASCWFIKYFQEVGNPSNKQTQIVMKGEITDVTTNEGEVRFTLVADLSVGLAQIGGQQVQPKCPLTFKSRECGWTVAQDGDPDYCDKQYESDSGCAGHENQHRFQGVIVGGDLTEPILGDGGGGGGIGGGFCFLAGTQITLADGSFKPIEKVRVTEVVQSFIDDGELEEDEVIATCVNTAYEYYTLKFVDGSEPIHCVGSHPFLTKDLEWVRAENLRANGEVFDGDGRLSKLASAQLVQVVDGVLVYNLTVHRNKTYLANNKRVHNKRIFPPDIYPTL